MLKAVYIQTFQSLPLRGAWIEITVKLDIFAHPQSLPLRGAWIEIG